MNKPDELIKLASLNDPCDVSIKMAKMRSQEYCYCFAYQPKNVIDFEVLKFGLSTQNPNRTSKSYGERIKRQIANLPGWQLQLPTSSHGMDLIKGIDDLKQRGILPKEFNRNDIIIGIWDIKFRITTAGINIPIEYRAAWLEGELCDQYFTRNGRLPYLNKSDPRNTKAYRQSLVIINDYLENFHDDQNDDQFGLDNFNFE